MRPRWFGTVRRRSQQQDRRRRRLGGRSELARRRPRRLGIDGRLRVHPRNRHQETDRWTSRCWGCPWCQPAVTALQSPWYRVWNIVGRAANLMVFSAMRPRFFCLHKVNFLIVTPLLAVCLWIEILGKIEILIDGRKSFGTVHKDSWVWIFYHYYDDTRLGHSFYSMPQLSYRLWRTRWCPCQWLVLTNDIPWTLSELFITMSSVIECKFSKVVIEIHII